MSEEMSMFGRAGVGRDSAHPGHREIPIEHAPQTSIDELLKVIKGANGMPVLFMPTSDGRLAAVAVDGLQSLMRAKCEGSDPVKKKEEDFRAWLFVLTSLVATVTFAAGLTPPGGFWADDNGYVAGTPIMRDKFSRRYFLFQYCNTCAFFTSLTIIASLAKNWNIEKIMTIPFTGLVGVCFLSMGISFIAGTWNSNAGPTQLWPAVFVLAINIVYMTGDRIKEMFSGI
uniref:PGG domain-containing protein n=1 Tax=Triticum urartu TaxID=4572 RepID=A0A8R7QYD6_TRIUA